MKFYSEILGLEDSQFILLRELIRERTGIFFDNGKKEILEDKLSPLVLERGIYLLFGLLLLP
jgi:chemotaxis protein methyltransferase CheR